MVEVIITQARQGPTVGYLAGQRALFSPEKAARAVANGWAKYATKQPKKAAEKPTAKAVPPSLSTVAGVLTHFDGDVDKMKEYASENGIYVHPRSRKPESVAERIAQANS